LKKIHIRSEGVQFRKREWDISKKGHLRKSLAKHGLVWTAVSAIYASAEVVMTRDPTPDLVETEAFVERRFEVRISEARACNSVRESGILARRDICARA
jgi:hypothetical protein